MTYAETGAAADLEILNLTTERDVAQQQAAAAVAREAATAGALTACQATRLTLEQRVRELEQLLAASSGVPAGWKVAFEDRFDGNGVDPAKWNVRSDTQSNHLGKNQPANARVSGGVLSLVCERLATPISGKPFSTAYLDTIGKSTVRYGRWLIRCRLTKAKGGWPAFWLRDAALPGEIDIMEAVSDGKGGGRIVFTVHQDTNAPKDAAGKPLTAKRGFEWPVPAWFDWNAFHDFEVEWDGTTMIWFVDGAKATSVTVAQLPWLATSFGPAGLNLRLNYQAGGGMPNWYGLPMDSASVLPDAFVVDSVRILTKA